MAGRKRATDGLGRTPAQVLLHWYESRMVEPLCKYLFPTSNVAQNMTPTQAEIIRDVVYSDERLLAEGLRGVDCCAMTQWGKTETFAVAYNTKMLFTNDLKIAIIASKWDKSEPIRNYIVEGVYSCPLLLNLADLERGGEERMKKEASKRRLTFKHGGEYRYYSAHGDAQRLMGHGLTKNTGVVHVEEAAEIKREAFAKIWRFLIGKLGSAVFNQTYNPWDRDTVAFDNSVDDEFKHYHVSCFDALEEGRITREDVELQRRKMTDLEFEVLMLSRFPQEAENQLISLAHVNASQALKLGLDRELEYVEKILASPQSHKEGVVAKAKRAARGFARVISCDPADLGTDWTVAAWATRKDAAYKVHDFYAEPKSDPMALADWLFEKAESFIGPTVPGEIMVDAIGIGRGAESALRKRLRNSGLSNVRVVACKNSESATDTRRFANAKAENYFGLAEKLREGLIDLPDKGEIADNKLNHVRKQLMSIKKAWTSSGVMKIEPPEKSPDWADSLMYMQWRKGPAFTWAVA